jgi:hypothetical protein
MKFPLLGLMTKSITTRSLVLLFAGMSMALSISAQRNVSRTLAPEAIGVDIEQCANGPLAAPIHCNVSNGNDGYTRGNLISSKSHYLEGDSVPIRIVATDLVVGETYMVTIGYDFTKGGKYATDYLTSYDRTESVQNDPCVGVTGCTLASEQEFPIPIDPQVTAGFDGIPGNSDDIVQIQGFFSCFGCTITSTTGYTLTGATTGDSSKSIKITFTADATNVVIAYGSHISTRSDWGQLNSAINISGSPYHNYIVDFPGANSGNRDLQLSAEAVIFPAVITIEKTVVTLDLQTSATFAFGFTSSAAVFPNTTSFSLVDNVAEPINQPRVGGTINSSNITSFGSGNLITVTENNYFPTWNLASITCVSTGGTENNTTSVPMRSATIQLEEGEFVKCTFNNTQLQPTAAPASISGRAVDSFGTGIGGARITVTDAQTGTAFVAITNPFGYYTIEGTEVENFYIMTISHKRYTFADDTRAFTLLDNLTGVDFVANP